MCGIVGLFNSSGEPASATLLRRMTDRIAHRGPDGDGYFSSGGVGFGHRRLAVLDLSPAGQQPMQTEDGFYVITYNGEVYNFRELRTELQAYGYKFQSGTDTEVVLKAYAHWGEKSVERFKGMFAFALLDRVKNQLFLARDRYGVKPLYWYWKSGLFAFASEIKALLENPAIERAVCYPALNQYFSFQNIFTELTLFEGIRLLSPGCTLTLDLKPNTEINIKKYWDYPFNAEPTKLSEEECADKLHQLVQEAVLRQLVSDVPIGSYLSGGMDSASITAMAVPNLPRLTTFTCGFDLTSASGLELAFDERAKAEVLSNLLKTEHYEVVLHAGDMENAMPNLIWHLEDLRLGQCYPNYYVARLASKFVKVVLSGAGGDELFGGYPWRYYRGMNSAGPQDFMKRYYDFWQRLVPDDDKKDLFTSETFSKLKDDSPFEAFRSIFDGWPGELKSKEDYVNASLYFELKTFLHGLLVVEDKLSMAHSLETRVPFLDEDLVNFSVNLPVKYRLRNLDRPVEIDENLPGKRQRYELQTSDGKLILRKAMAKLLPEAIVQRAKQGFSAPDESWYRGESIEYVNRQLRNPKAKIYNYLREGYVTKILDEHCSGTVNRRLLIWSFLSFEWWLNTFIM